MLHQFSDFMILVLMAATIIPGLNPQLNTQPLPLSDLLICTGLSSLTLFVVEREKLLVRRG